MSSSSTGFKMIQLKTSDNEIYRVEEAVAKQSGVIRTFLEVRGDDENVPIPLPNVRGRALRMVMEWISKHTADADADADEKLEEKKELQDWESKFMELDLNATYDLLMAAHYLEVTGLFHRLCEKVAGILTGKTPEEIRRIFKIKNDFTPEEEAENRRRLDWFFNSKSTTK